MKTDETRAPVVVNLLNHDYDEAADTILRQSDVVVRMRPELFGGEEVTEAVLFAPGSAPTEVSIETKSDGILVTLPRLDLWGILRLS